METFIRTDTVLFPLKFCDCYLGLLSAGAVECGHNLPGYVAVPASEVVVVVLCTPGKVGLDPRSSRGILPGESHD